MKISLNIFLFLACFAFQLPAYSQGTIIVPDSVWETPSSIIFYGKEQASIGNHMIIEILEKDRRFQNFSVEAKVNFYDQIQERFVSSCPDRACQFDFETFLSAYSSVVYKPLLLLLYCLKNHKSDFSRKQFNACLSHQCKGEELADNGKPLIERIAKNYEQYLDTPFAKSVDFEAERRYCQALNVNEQNAYLHVRGHNLFELVAYIGDLLCRGTSLSFKKDVLINDLPPQTYWQIQNITKDLSIIIQ